MTIDDLVRMNGPSASPVLFDAAAQNVRRDFWAIDWHALGFGVTTFDQKKVETLVAGIAGSVVPFKTDKGIALLASKRSDILKAYRNPTAEIKGTPGRLVLIYDEIGLAFNVYDAGGGIRLIYVFRSRTAKNFWKF